MWRVISSFVLTAIEERYDVYYYWIRTFLGNATTKIFAWMSLVFDTNIVVCNCTHLPQPFCKKGFGFKKPSGSLEKAWLQNKTDPFFQFCIFKACPLYQNWNCFNVIILKKMKVLFFYRHLENNALFLSTQFEEATCNWNFRNFNNSYILHLGSIYSSSLYCYLVNLQPAST